MSEYYIRLDTLLGTDFPEKLPVLGYLAKNLGVRQWRETWNADATVTSAEAVLDGEIAWEVGGFRFSFGDPAGGQTAFRLEIASDRKSLLTSIADRGEEMAGITNPPPREGLQIFARADGPPSASRIQLHDLDLRIRLPEKWAKKGKVVGDRIEPDGDHPVDIAFLHGTLVFDPEAAKPIQYVLDDDEAVTVDPIFIPQLGIGIEIDKLKLDLSEDTGIPEVLARPGYQESWTGLYLEKFKIYGMHVLFPTLPPKIDPNAPADLIIELSKVVIGFDDGGVTGSLKVQMHAPPDDDRVLVGAGFELELERGNLIRFEHDLTLRLGKSGGPDFASQVNHDLQIVASMRHGLDDRWGWELALKTPGTKDTGLLTLGPITVLALQDAIGFWLLMNDIIDANYTDAALLAGLLYLLNVLQVNHNLDFKRFTIDALKLRHREDLVAGRVLKYIDVILDIQLQVGLDLPLGDLLPWAANALPDIRTDPDHPLGILMRELRISYAYNFDDFTEAELAGRRKHDFAWPKDYLFDFSNQTLLHDSPVMLTKFGFGRWDRGVWMDLGLKLAVNEPAASYGLVPSVVRLYFLTTGELDHATFEGLSLSILVPGVLFVRGRLNLADTMTEASLQGYFVSSPGLSIKEYNKPENWNWDVGAQYRKQTLTDGTESSIVFAWLKSSSGIPVFFLPGTALYGGHFLYAKNARPALGGDTIETWFTEHEPKNQIVIDKWEGNADSTGIGFGLVLGAQADRGRPWNLQLGLLYADSQWLLNGYLNLFKQRPDPADTSKGSLRILGAWSHDRLFASVHWVEQVPADGKVMKIDLGAELLVDDAHDQSHFYAGFHWPPEKHLKAVLLERYEAGFYLMQDAADIENFAGQGVTVPGFVSALGVSFSVEGGRRKGHLKLYFYLHASADLAFADADPFLTVIHAAVAGGIVAKAYGIGFEFEVEAEFLWVRPQPSILTGKLKITLDLPWPIPNLHYTLDCDDGSDGPTEDLHKCIEGLTLTPRVPQGVVALGGADQPLVPLDAVLTLAFSYATRNGPAVDGNFQIAAVGLDAVDTSVVHKTSGEGENEHGYAVELTALRLWHGAPGSGTLHPGPVPARWIKQQTAAPGGEPSRRILELFSLEDVAVARLIGPSAELISDLTAGWSPCAPDSPPSSICYRWTDEPLGSIGDTELVEAADAPTLRVMPLPEPEGAESTRRFFGWIAQPAEVVPFTLLSDLGRALRLPATKGLPLPDTPAAAPLELRFETAHTALVEIVRPARGRRVTVRFYFGERLVKEDPEGIRAPGLEGIWEHVLYTCDGPVNRAVIETLIQGNPAGQGPASVPADAAFVARVCVVPEAAWRRYQNAVDSGHAWDDFWTTLNTADPLVLQPGTHYTLQVEGIWARVTNGAESPGGTFDETFEFDTVPLDQWPQRLRGIDQSVDGKANYDVKTVPTAGAVSVYAGRSIRIEFRNRRIEPLYAAFGRRLAIRLVDDQGDMDTRWLDCTPEPPSDLPAGELAWLGVVRSTTCTPGDVELHWHLPVVRLTDVLAPGRRYDSSLFALESSTDDLGTVDWQTQPVLYQFTFRTSHWPTFAAHVAAYKDFDEIVPVPVDFGALAAAIGASPRVADDGLLATAMTELLGLPPRDPANEPELIRVWQTAGAGEQLVALLLDGPEPLPRPVDGALELRTAADVPIPITLVQAASGTRSLILFRDGGSGYTTFAPAPLRLALSDTWIAADGSTQVDNAVLNLAMPTRPAFLEPEGVP
jgi:hypothetical protein